MEILKRNITLLCVLLVHSGVQASNIPDQTPVSFDALHKPALLSYDPEVQQDEIGYWRFKDSDRSTEMKKESDQQKVRSIEYNKAEDELAVVFNLAQERIQHWTDRPDLAQDMAREFLPLYLPAPEPQVMEDSDFKADDKMAYDWYDKDNTFYFNLGPDDLEKNWNIKLNQAQWDAIRIKVARWYLKPNHGLFQSESPTKKRCEDMCNFGTCHAAKVMYLMAGEPVLCASGENGATLPYLCPSAVFCSPCICAAATVVGCVEATAKTIEAPCAASYVCCNAECARKCYRARYEKSTLHNLGITRK